MQSKQNSVTGRHVQDVLYLILLCVAAFFLLWKCRYGFGNVDESFYLTVPYRLLQGDALFRHEWHLSQMAGFLTMPVVRLLIGLNGGTDGLILSMRYATTIIQCVIALVAYRRLRAFSWTGAAVASLSFIVYIPFGIMALSYNSMGIMALVLSGLAMLPSKRGNNVRSLLSGISFAAAVLCCPYLLIGYILYTVAVIISALHGQKNREALCSVCRWLWFTAGAAVMAGVFGAFVLSRAPLQSIIQSFSQIMNDPEHPPLSIISKIRTFLRQILYATDISHYIYIVILGLFIGCVLDRRRIKHRLVWFCLAAVATLILMLGHYRHWQYINMVMWAINALAVFAVLLSKNPIVKRFFGVFWILGMIYSFCLHLGSNQRFYAISSASAVCTMGSIMMIAVLVKEIYSELRIPVFKISIIGLTCVLFGFQLFSQTDLRYKNVFWEDGISSQTVPVHEGLQSGLLVSDKMAEEYAQSLRRLEELETFEGKKLLYMTKNTWYYFVHDCEMASYSAWLSGKGDSVVARLEEWYRINPDKLPDVIFADEAYEQEALMLGDKLNYRSKTVDGGLILLPS